jgi:ubiquinone/menaquinone biosynthesis C-methylase UbiE
MKERFYKASIGSLKEFWEEKGRTGSFERGYHIRYEGITNIIEKLADSLDGKLVLDIGCGPGIIPSLFPSKTKVIGLDFSIAMLQSATSRIQQVIRATAFNLPFHTEVFEVVTCFFVMSDYSLKHPFFLEVNRVLQNNGLFVFVDYSPNDEHWRLKKKIRLLLGQNCNIFIENTKYLQSKLKQTGFHLLQTELIQFSPKFELTRYIPSARELKQIKKRDPILWKDILLLNNSQEIKREFIFVIAKKPNHIT